MILARPPQLERPPLGPELQLLLDCARARFDAQATDRLDERLEAAPLDWDRLLLLADRHGLTPLLFLQVERLGRAAAPASMVESLRARASRNTARQLSLVAELREILDLFERHGIHAVPLRGPALAAALYGNVALREAKDLDLMVRRADLPPARRLLLERGYERDVRLGPAVGAMRFESGCNLEMRRRGDGQKVELHWALLHRYYSAPPEETCWSRLTRASLLGREVPSLSPEDQLLVLCGHAGKYSWQRLIWMCDVAQLLRRHRDLNWERLWSRAERLGGTRTVSLGLHLTGTWLGVALPDEVRRRLVLDRRVPALARSLMDGLGAFEGRGAPDMAPPAPSAHQPRSPS